MRFSLRRHRSSSAGALRIAAVLAVVLGLGLPCAASAGVASADSGRVAFTDPAGVADDLYVTIEQGTTWVVGFLQYSPATTPGPGCAVGFVSIECDVGPNPPATVTVDGGGGNDILEIEGRPGPPGTVTVAGGAGDDQLATYATKAELDGGEGNDLIAPDERVAIGELPPATPGSVIRGGAGGDTVTYPSTISEIAVSLDGVANDGRPGEGDNVLSDVENVSGSDFGNVILGSAAANVLGGGGGNDRIAGLAGSDTISGSSGDDDLNALDAGAGDRVDCSTGVDSVQLDAGDSIADDSCEKAVWAPGMKGARLRFREGRVPVSLACPKAAAGCRGTVLLRSSGQKPETLARGRYQIKRGKRLSVEAKATKNGRSVLAGGRTEAELTIEPRGADAPAGRRVNVSG